MNCILNNSEIIKKELNKLSSPKDPSKRKEHYMDMMKFHKKNLSLSVEILHSARIMHYYNSNILERIKIKKKEAAIKTTTCKDPKIYA